jgi:CxxC motif-containing protein (DUF1111 family)
MRRILSTCIGIGLGVAGGCANESVMPEPGEELSGGAFTVFEAGPSSFGHPVPELDLPLERAFFRGRALFRDDWVVAPASTSTRDGLGPLFNARSCEACHLADGRGRPPIGTETELGPMLVRLGPLADPSYGTQLQPFASPGVTREGRVVVTYEEESGTYGDGTTYSLRRPHYMITDLGYGPLAPATVLSARVPPVMIGMGLLEAIDDATLLALADPDDVDGDGISGRLGEGRFGLTAAQPSVVAQTEAAFAGDLGLTSSGVTTDDCTAAQTACLDATSGGAPEVIETIVADLTVYAQLLAVPARRAVADPAVLRGKQHFVDAGCARCHTPRITAGTRGLELFAGADLRPFTDLLLHDLGPDLADAPGIGTEWRTPPLWGLGLTQVVSGHTLLLHDGRARDAAEAILWHGGEAATTQQYFLNLPEADRDDLLAFLDSL